MQFRNNRWLVLFLALSLGGGVLSSAQEPAGSPRSVSAIKSRAEFDSLAVTYDPDTPYALPHVLFVIDRKDRNKIYYVNTKRYAFHKDFVNGTYLSLERGREFFENNYLKANRRFILGTIAYQTGLGGDQLQLFYGGCLQTQFYRPGRRGQEDRRSPTRLAE